MTSGSLGAKGWEKNYNVSGVRKEEEGKGPMGDEICPFFIEVSYLMSVSYSAL